MMMITVVVVAAVVATVKVVACKHDADVSSCYLIKRNFLMIAEAAGQRSH